VQASISDLAGQTRQLHENNAQIIGELWGTPRPQLQLSSVGERLAQTERRTEVVGKEAVSIDLVRAVLDMVWERFKASGHIETQAGGALERLVALVPRPPHEPPPVQPTPREADAPGECSRVDSMLASAPWLTIPPSLTIAPSLTTWPDNFDYYING